ncbi:NmrA-like family [Seminavis robusta]|uniref:NmrA-like family n=1 Tax=Seminavis robusta TaxID=568900 RepID=A0A9N8E7S1_9STRA|nr:NmrA-like family [Seminavis robusta]|eukprot:Sro761_g198510.1 NmrA-like family (397) ;mRNA; r:20608-21798
MATAMGVSSGLPILGQPGLFQAVCFFLLLLYSHGGASALSSSSSSPPSQKNTIAVFGGSGFIGRRVCEQLSYQENVHVISISRSGRPPDYYCPNHWNANQVDWIQADMLSQTIPALPPLTAAVSLVGNVEPVPHWKGFFGLGFDDEKLRIENGLVNERICQAAKHAGAERFVFVSVSYEVAKAFEGPIEGYLDGKRRAEFAASDAFGNDNTVVLGPSVVYGGKRFPRLGKLYRSFVESKLAKAYVTSNQALRNLSVAPLQDWLEQAIFSSPVDVSIVANVICAAALGQVDRSVVPTRRRQGFWNEQGDVMTYADVIFVDGTHEIERVSQEVALLEPLSNKENINSARAAKEPIAEGGMENVTTYLRPLPVVAFFATIFWAVMTQQFIQTVQILPTA